MCVRQNGGYYTSALGKFLATEALRSVCARAPILNSSIQAKRRGLDCDVLVFRRRLRGPKARAHAARCFRALVFFARLM